MKKGCLIFLIGMSIALLSGCNEVEEILGKLNQILDQQLASEDEEDADSTVNQTESEEEEIAVPEDAVAVTNASEEEVMESDGHENEADPMPSFEERFKQAGYAQIDPPNGLPLPILEDWILVEENEGDDYPWIGVFCFETDMDQAIAGIEENIMQYELDTVFVEGIAVEDSEEVHRTTFEFSDASESWKGDMVFFADDYGTSCTTVSLEYVE